MGNQHIAKKGKHAGTFVPCQAKTSASCRNQGVHINNDAKKVLRKEYGEANLQNYAKALVAGKVSPASQESKPLNLVFSSGNLTFNKDSSQEEFNKFLTDNNVRASAEIRDFVDKKFVGTGEYYDLYRVENMALFSVPISQATPCDTPEQAEKLSQRTLQNARKEASDYSVSDNTIKNILKVASTPGATKRTKENLDALGNILEDINYHSLNAYFTAVRNKSGSGS